MGDLDPKSVVRTFVMEILNGPTEERMADLVACEPLAHRLSAFRRAFPDLRTRLEQIVAEQDLVAVHLTVRGTHHGLFQGCPPTGRSWASSCTALFRVTDNRITDFWLTWDELSILEQIGAVARVGAVSA